MRRNCVYCGNTGTVNGDWCPVCRPSRAFTLNHAGRRTAAKQSAVLLPTKEHFS